MHLTVLALSGENLQLTVDPNCLIRDVKNLIRDLDGRNVGIELCASGTVLKDEETVASLGLASGSVISIVRIGIYETTWCTDSSGKGDAISLVESCLARASVKKELHGQLLRCADPLPSRGVHYFEVTYYARANQDDASTLLGGTPACNKNVVFGVISGDVKPSVYHGRSPDGASALLSQAMNQDGGWWGITGACHAFRNGKQVLGLGQCLDDREPVGLLVNRDECSMIILRKGKPLLEMGGLPLTADLWPVACPYGESEEVHIIFPRLCGGSNAGDFWAACKQESSVPIMRIR